MSDGILIPLIILGLNLIGYGFLALMGWMGKQMWEHMKKENGEGGKKRSEILERISHIQEKIDQNTSVLDRIERTVTRQGDELRDHRKRLIRLEVIHDTREGKVGSDRKAEGEGD